MPWKIVKGHSRCKSGFAVVHKDGSGFRGCHKTRKAAEDQIKALHSSKHMKGQGKHKPS